MPTITVFDPPMCCSTGVCGPEVDPTLVQFAGDLAWLASAGIEVRRVNLAQEPECFIENPAVREVLNRSGTEELPVIMVDEALVAIGRYPGRDELAAMAGVKAAVEPTALSEQMKELVALAAAIGANCAPCFKFHHDKARNLGTPVALMREAVQIGNAVKAASAMNILGVADRLLGGEEQKAAPAACCGRRGATQEKSSGCC